MYFDGRPIPNSGSCSNGQFAIKFCVAQNTNHAFFCGLVIGQLSFGQLSFGQLSFGQLSFGQLSFGQLSRSAKDIVSRFADFWKATLTGNWEIKNPHCPLSLSLSLLSHLFPLNLESSLRWPASRDGWITQHNRPTIILHDRLLSCHVCSNVSENNCNILAETSWSSKSTRLAVSLT